MLWSKIRPVVEVVGYFGGICGLGWAILQFVMDAIPPQTALGTVDIVVGAAGVGMLLLGAVLHRSLTSIWQGAIQAAGWGLFGAGAGTLRFIARDGHGWSDALLDTKIYGVAAFLGGAAALLGIRQLPQRYMPDDKRF